MNSENDEDQTLADSNGDESAVPPQPPSEPAVTSSGKPRSGGALAALALIISAIALLGSGWLIWQKFQDSGGAEDFSVQLNDAARRQDEQRSTLQSELESAIADVQSRIANVANDDGRAELEQMETRLQRRLEGVDAAAAGTRQQLMQKSAQQNASIADLQSAFESTQSRLMAMESGLAAVAAKELDSSTELDLDEVDFLLRLASERLQLFSDTTSTDRALELADQHLEALNSPLYLGVRQQISLARQRLAQVELPDWFGIARRLDSLQGEVMRAPFIGQRQQADVMDISAQEQGWWPRIKGVFSSLVTVRRQAEDEQLVLSLEDKDLIRQGLWLQFETARLALMRGDQAVYTSTLENTAGSIDQWFGPEGGDGDSSLDSVRSQVLELSALQISPELPDVSAPWTQMRQLRSGRAAIRSATREQAEPAPQIPPPQTSTPRPTAEIEEADS